MEVGWDDKKQSAAFVDGQVVLGLGRLELCIPKFLHDELTQEEQEQALPQLNPLDTHHLLEPESSPQNMDADLKLVAQKIYKVLHDRYTNRRDPPGNFPTKESIQGAVWTSHVFPGLLKSDDKRYAWVVEGLHEALAGRFAEVFEELAEKQTEEKIQRESLYAAKVTILYDRLKQMAAVVALKDFADDSRYSSEKRSVARECLSVIQKELQPHVDAELGWLDSIDAEFGTWENFGALEQHWDNREGSSLGKILETIFKKIRRTTKYRTFLGQIRPRDPEMSRLFGERYKCEVSPDVIRKARSRANRF